MRDLSGQLTGLFEKEPNEVSGAAIPWLSGKVVLIEAVGSFVLRREEFDKFTTVTTVTGITLCQKKGKLVDVEIHTNLTQSDASGRHDFLLFNPKSGFRLIGGANSDSLRVTVQIWG